MKIWSSATVDTLWEKDSGVWLAKPNEETFERGLRVNGLRLCDGGAIEAQIFNFAQKFNRRTTVELCSFAPLLQNPC